MKKIIIVGLKTVGSLILGTIISLSTLHDDARLKKIVEHAIIHSVTSVTGEPLHLVVTKIDFLRGHIMARDIAIASRSNSWSLTCPLVLIHFSFLPLITRGQLYGKLIFERPKLFTVYDKKFAIQDPFLAHVNAPARFPLRLVSYAIHDGIMNVKSAAFSVHALCSTTTSIHASSAVTHCYCKDGTLERKNRSVAQKMTGDITVEVPFIDPLNYSFKTKLRGLFHISGKRFAIVHGSYLNRLGTFQWYPENSSVRVDAKNVVLGAESITGGVTVTGKFAECSEFFTDRLKTSEGTTRFGGTFSLTNELHYEGSALIEQFLFKGLAAKKTTMNLKGTPQLATGTIRSTGFFGIPFEGMWSANLENAEIEGTLHLSKRANPFPLFLIENNDSTLSFAFAKGKLSGVFSVFARIQKGELFPIKGTFNSDSAHGLLKGATQNYAFKVEGAYDPFSIAIQLVNRAKKKYINLQGTLTDLVGHVHFDLIRKLIHLATGHELQGDALVKARMKFDRNSSNVNLSFEKANIQLPGISNLIKFARGNFSYDQENATIIAKKMHIEFQKGQFDSDEGIIRFTKKGTLKNVHFPLILRNSFMQWKTDFSGTFSGGLNVDYADGQWLCSGLIGVEEGFLKSAVLTSGASNDLFSSSSQSSLLKATNLHVRFYTKTPLKVQTFIFNTDAQFDLFFKGSAENPQVDGTIEINPGTFGFLYKPLLVTAAKLYLDVQEPKKTSLPTPSTSVKKQKASGLLLRVTGTARQPKVTLDSGSTLVQDESISSLVSSSDKGSLLEALPGAVISQVEKLLFGDGKKSVSKTQSVLKGLLKPLKSLRDSIRSSEKDSRTAPAHSSSVTK